MNGAYRSIPKVDAVLNEQALQELPYAPEIVKRVLRETLDAIREDISQGRIAKSPDASQVAGYIAGRIRAIMESGLKPVINAAGVVVYTNLGRAPLAPEAIDAVVEAARGYSDLEYTLPEGGRGSRQDHIRPITRLCFGADDALVVNNNAAAVLLVLATLAQGKEVIVSRGELVEIGGSFRMPDVMTMSGAIMREVGTTNKTRLSDYRDAVTDNTGLILKVHRSNFAIVGFTDEVGIAELTGLGREMGIPVFVDMGSGVPFDLTASGIPGEWTIQSCLDQGSDVLSFSGDKVLGGPQAGIILGRADLVGKMASHPLHRALRVDKMTIAALNVTLRLIAQGKSGRIPVLQMITEPPDEVKKRAQGLAGLLGKKKATVVPTQAVIGGGSAPTKAFPSFGVVMKSAKATQVHARLRTCTPAVVCRIEEDTLIFDVKAVRDEEIPVLAEKINEVFKA
ncbi:MAG TPA: L-seryl-tRNA(Sec) selenium transferase [Deltaproteobacteria bacterium]|nr:L-seryl-tRNA(Sec) selenium transferase [Deltaproteobacteria bacterium]